MESKSTPRALAVDDSRECRALLSRALQREHIQCDVASDGVEAEYMLEANKYDVLLTDLRMPRKHGHQLIMEVLAKEDPPMIIVMTGIMEPRLVADLIGRGVVDVIQKPLAFDIIAAKVKALLERRGAFGSGGRADGTKVAHEIGKATNAMREQLAQVTSSFESAIRDLDRQKTEIEEGYHSSLRMLTNLFEKMGTSRGSHAGRVEKMASCIGDKLGLPGNERRNVVFASLLHDVGQFGMPDTIRMKPPWTLTEEERGVFQAYPVIGAMLLSEVRGADKVAEFVEAHTENFDGSGFPKKLKGTQIPLGARIVRVADGCDTHLMFSAGGHPIEEVRKHLLSGKSRAYDPDLVEMAISCAVYAFVETPVEDVMEIPVPEAYPGLILAENVYDEEGRFLAREGAELSANMLSRMRWLVGTQRIAVRKPHQEGRTGEDG